MSLCLFTEEELREHPPVLVWSGGCDSTLLLYELSESCKEYDITLDVISYNIDLIVGAKRDAETVARERILKKLRDNGAKIRHDVIDISTNGDRLYEKGDYYRFGQQLNWATYSLIYAPRNSAVYFGYIRGEHYTSSIAEFKCLVTAMNNLMCKYLIVETPLIEYDKQQIIASLIKADLYDDVWFCEAPVVTKGDGESKVTQCHECDACKEHMVALMGLCTTSLDPIVQKKATNVLKDDFGISINRVITVDIPNFVKETVEKDGEKHD